MKLRTGGGQETGLAKECCKKICILFPLHEDYGLLHRVHFSLKLNNFFSFRNNSNMNSEIYTLTFCH
jgi:hypothetical protein